MPDCPKKLVKKNFKWLNENLLTIIHILGLILKLEILRNDLSENNWVFATNSEFIIPISLEPNVINLWYFKLILFYLTEFIVWNIYDLRHWNPKILGLEKQSLWQNSIPFRWIINCFDLKVLALRYTTSSGLSFKPGV